MPYLGSQCSTFHLEEGNNYGSRNKDDKTLSSEAPAKAVIVHPWYDEEWRGKSTKIQCYLSMR